MQSTYTLLTQASKVDLEGRPPVLKRGSWECWLAGSNRVDLSPPASLRIRDPFLRLATLFQTSVGLTRCASAPCLPSDARVSCLPRFLMRRPPSGDGFLFTSSRLGLLRSGVPERGAFLAVHTSPPGFSPSCDFDPPRSRIVTLLPPLSPFGPVPALLPFPSLGRSRLQSTPSRGSLDSHCCFTNYLHRRCVKGLVRPTFHAQLLWVPSTFGSLRSPCGFQ